MELLSCPFCGCKKTDEGSCKYFCRACGASVDKNTWNIRHSPWISVKDRLPDNEDKVLIITKFPENFLSIMSQRYDQKFGHYYKESKEWNILHNIYDLEVTHWIPLPSLPEEK